MLFLNLYFITFSHFIEKKKKKIKNMPQIKKSWSQQTRGGCAFSQRVSLVRRGAGAAADTGGVGSRRPGAASPWQRHRDTARPVACHPPATLINNTRPTTAHLYTTPYMYKARPLYKTLRSGDVNNAR